LRSPKGLAASILRSFRLLFCHPAWIRGVILLRFSSARPAPVRRSSSRSTGKLSMSSSSPSQSRSVEAFQYPQTPRPSSQGTPRQHARAQRRTKISPSFWQAGAISLVSSRFSKGLVQQSLILQNQAG
jgi:hypothetical protein